MIRTVARPLMGSLFLVAGADVLRNPEGRAKMARPVVEKMAETAPIFPEDPVTAVRVNASVHLVGGAMLILGLLPRVAALALAGSLVPTTFAGHRFWEAKDPATRAQQRTHFLKNLAILGGLLVTALD